MTTITVFGGSGFLGRRLVRQLLAEGATVRVAVRHPDPDSWKLTTDKDSPQVLRLRLTDVPGWHASIDGHPLKLYPFAGIMLQALVPPGHHTIELHYWPTTFTEGIVLALCSALGLLLVLLLSWLRRRRHPPHWHQTS